MPTDWLKRLLLPFLFVVLALTACSPLAKPTPTPTTTVATTNGTVVPFVPGGTYAYTPQEMRLAYGVESLAQRGYTGKGQTVVVIDSFGSPTLQQDLNVFNQRFNLPPITVKVLAPLGTKPFDPNNADMQGWATETELDVQMIHSIAPDAGIVVLTSPVSETEGTIGLPEFRKLEQYAMDHHLGSIVSQSWGVSEATLADAAGQQEIQQWTAFYQQATTQQGVTFLTGSGDSGATDYADINMTRLSQQPTTSFPSDSPWVTTVGGTTLYASGSNVREQAWSDSGGGFSAFFPTPSYQQTLPADVQSELNHRRGVPDVAAAADPQTGLQIYVGGHWGIVGGTSAAAPLWAGLVAIADQMAGRPIGFINPALYSLAEHHAGDFRDITQGNNSVNQQNIQVQGYAAAPGWDPVTGLGAPNAAKLLPDLVAATKPQG